MINEKEIASLITLLDDPDPQIFEQIEDRLLSYGNEVINYLETAWEKSFDALLQERIENLVHKIQYQNVKEDLALWYQSGGFDLLRGILIINKYQYPDLNEQKIINQLEALKRDIWLQMMYDASPVEKIKLINHIFYNVYGFSGNTTNHQDPKNSYLSEVMESKKGNQISLAIIYSIIAQKLDIPIYGVNLPQHFILAYADEQEKTDEENGILFYINVFNKGYIFGKRDIDQFLRQLKIQPEKFFYEPCSNTDILRRVLRNLISSYEKAGAMEKAKELQVLLSVLDD
ncbi:MAG: transglutaminase-like domain-containing protein [Bacteroidetes bacterium]|nr:transglutaminase-like domain-containing protein [Bacteroidota bacterium]MBU1372434.1 transglutaminase-like domain-containing protein [Bacteroidota bacterium]MBU1483458.1 transglutaminase-like domain-containing protein [Bacteroidota bacterium]MBU1760962.1 transglutaminase-like domain-containing protein [Bacteroidota bacterium]MBU2269196.1 transglutaminase-like domain-containing protein [Bacteroidota bacterium]